MNKDDHQQHNSEVENKMAPWKISPLSTYRTQASHNAQCPHRRAGKLKMYQSRKLERKECQRSARRVERQCFWGGTFSPQKCSRDGGIQMKGGTLLWGQIPMGEAFYFGLSTMTGKECCPIESRGSSMTKNCLDLNANSTPTEKHWSKVLCSHGQLCWQGDKGTLCVCVGGKFCMSNNDPFLKGWLLVGTAARGVSPPLFCQKSRNTYNRISLLWAEAASGRRRGARFQLLSRHANGGSHFQIELTLNHPSPKVNRKWKWDWRGVFYICPPTTLWPLACLWRRARSHLGFVT